MARVVGFEEEPGEYLGQIIGAGVHENGVSITVNDLQTEGARGSLSRVLERLTTLRAVRDGGGRGGPFA